MLNSETKRHIDAARDVLVGVAPNPTTQIDQITYALIYKFMDDMDQASKNAGGEASFFTGELAQFSWTAITDSRLGNQEKSDLYRRALEKFAVAPQLPELFRNIFTAAILPYNNPETLGLFLKEIDYFDYKHSEELGNAYEYLLSLMSSQGELGQFRTPRHIIDFIVQIVDPKLNERILDPACGTAGFLISAYKHILEHRDAMNEPSGKEKSLSPDQRKVLMQNLEGFDTDHTMVRLGQVNMYLHQFKNPKIIEHDTLTNETYWAEKFDVILANPPFMTPKGGIRPHSKFSMKSSRAEVLFVDYIINHLKPNGRAGIVVPEGVLISIGSSFRALRKELLDGGLYAVISLPVGVFNPYSQKKTSILLIDKKIAHQFDEILFLKINNDGFDKGATRNPILENDLPMAHDIIHRFKLDEFTTSDDAFTVKKSDILSHPEITLLGDSYSRISNSNISKWEHKSLSEIAKISAGNSAPQDPSFFVNGYFPFIRTSDLGAVHTSSNLIECRDKLNEAGIKKLKLFPAGTILFPKSGASTFLNHRAILGMDAYVVSHLATIEANPKYVNYKYLYYLLLAIDAKELTADQDYPSLRLTEIGDIKVPVPPLDIQESIVKAFEDIEQRIFEAENLKAQLQDQLELEIKKVISS